jgi:hypothetical protein
MTTKIHSIFPIILVLIFCISCGCINSQPSSDRNITTPAPTFTVLPTITNNSANVTPTVTTPYSDVPGIIVFTDKPKYKVGEDVTVGITNNLNVPIRFAVGAPFWTQYQTNGTWRNVTLGGGTQGFWSLKPGQSYTWPWNVEGMYDFDYVRPDPYTDPFKPFTVVPGIYRVIIGGTIDSKYQETFVMQKEFIIE